MTQTCTHRPIIPSIVTRQFSPKSKHLLHPGPSIFVSSLLYGAFVTIRSRRCSRKNRGKIDGEGFTIISFKRVLSPERISCTIDSGESNSYITSLCVCQSADDSQQRSLDPYTCTTHPSPFHIRISSPQTHHGTTRIPSGPLEVAPNGVTWTISVRPGITSRSSLEYMFSLEFSTGVSASSSIIRGGFRPASKNAMPSGALSCRVALCSQKISTFRKGHDL